MLLDSSAPFHDPQALLRKFFAPAPHLQDLLAARPEQFFIIRVEDLYRHVRGPVPAVRSAGHTALFVSTGAARMAVGYDHYSVQAGELLLVPAGQVYSFQPHDVNTGYLCHFHPELLRRAGTTEPELLTGWGYPLVRFGAAGPAEFVRLLLARMLAVYEAEALAGLDRLLPALAALLAEASHAGGRQPGPAPSAAARLTQAFKTLLSQRIRQQHWVAAYAELLHVTPNHLNKAVKAVSGQPATRWIDRALVLEAKALLLQTTLPVAEVAAQVGLADPSYFSRLFRKLEGQTPRAWQQAASKSAA